MPGGILKLQERSHQLPAGPCRSVDVERSVLEDERPADDLPRQPAIVLVIGDAKFVRNVFVAFTHRSVEVCPPPAQIGQVPVRFQMEPIRDDGCFARAYQCVEPLPRAEQKPVSTPGWIAQLGVLISPQEIRNVPAPPRTPAGRERCTR